MTEFQIPNSRFQKIMLFFICSLFAISSYLFPQTPFGTEDWSNFSAYVETTSYYRQGRSIKSYKFYFKKGKSRVDFLGTSPIETIITIREKDGYVDYIKLEKGGWRKQERFFKRIDKNTYRIQPKGQPAMIVKRKDLPEDNFQGKRCIVRKFIFLRGGRALLSSKMYLWKEKMVPLKVEVKSPAGKNTTIYKDISFKGISDGLFEVPIEPKP